MESDKQPETIRQIQALVEQEGPLFRVPKKSWLNIFEYRPWISVDRKPDCYSVMLASGRTTHQPLHGPAYMVDFDLDTGELRSNFGLTGAWKSAISMWPIRDRTQAEQVYQRAVALLERCYQHYCA